MPPCILVAEQRFRDLSAIAQAERLGLAAARNEALRRRMLVLEGCELWARELGQIGLQSTRLEDPELVRLVRRDRGSDRRRGARAQPTDPPIGIPTSNRPAAPVVPPGDDLPRAVRLLLRIEAALVHFAAR